jgi:predicted dehydrogenase
MQRSVAGLAAAGLPVWYARNVHGADESNKAAAARPRAANDKLAVGWVGIGSPGGRAFQVHGTTRNIAQLQHVAVCDVDARHAYYAGMKLGETAGRNNRLATYKDFRRLTERKDIDLVVVATPDHWHALVAIDAMRRGKDVYCEKPLTLTIAEAVALMKAQKETGRVLQTGSQQRTEMGGKFRLAAELVRAGRVGKVKTIECRIGDNPQSGPIPEAPVPDGLDWDLWLGPTPKVPYRYKDGKSNCHYEFRWWGAYSGGKLTDWGAHHIDIAQWCLGKDGSGPTSVECLEHSDIYDKGDGYDWPADFKVRFEYPGDVEVLVSSRKGTDADLFGANGQAKKVRGGENGVLVVGDAGKLFVSRGDIAASDAKILSEPLKEDPKLYDGRPTNHFQNFVDCVVSRKEPICSATVGGGSVIVCHLAAIALRTGTGKKLAWDPEKHEFSGSGADAANAKLSREMRGGWKL